MTNTAQATHRFTVRARNADFHHAHAIDETSFEAAAIAYIETFAAETAEPQVSVIVRDAESGHEQCFRLDLETGEAAPCG